MRRISPISPRRSRRRSWIRRWARRSSPARSRSNCPRRAASRSPSQTPAGLPRSRARAGPSRALRVARAPRRQRLQGPRLFACCALARGVVRVHRMARRRETPHRSPRHRCRAREADRGAFPDGYGRVARHVRRGLPSGVLELAQSSGVGLHALETLHEEPGIANIADLRAAATAGRLQSLEGFGAKKESKDPRGDRDLRGLEPAPAPGRRGTAHRVADR